MKKRLEAKVIGRVQMVMYRDFAVRNARKLGLTGCVKNEEDGSVSVIAEGEEESLAEFVLRLKKGSLLAQVDSVEVKWMEPYEEFMSFTIVYE